MVSLAKCCRPIKGDAIVGYITRGEGITIHKNDCVNILNDSDRLIEVSWNDKSDNSYLTNITIVTEQDKNYLLDILTLATMKNIIIDSVKTLNQANYNKYEIVVKVKSSQELNKLKLDLEKQRYVVEVI